MKKKLIFYPPSPQNLQVQTTWQSSLHISDAILEAAKYLSIIMMVIQLLFSATLQVFQVIKVKGAIRIYLLFDFLSVFAVNTGVFFQIRDTKETLDEWNTIFGFQKGNKFGKLEQNISPTILIEDIIQLFVDLRKVFLILIINDAYIMLCQPFLFKEYLEVKRMLKRYLAALGFWFTFHILHVFAIATNISYLVTRNFSAEKLFLVMYSLGWQWSAPVLVFVYDGMLLVMGVMRCWAMLGALREMDQNEFAKNSHCESLFKMSVVFCILTAISIVRDVISPIAASQLAIMEQSVYFGMAKVFFDTFFSIIIMISLVIFFPGLRPRLSST